MEEKIISKSWRTPPAPVPESEIVREYSADVIVAGLGHAGTAAARAAAETGAKVFGIEKMEREKFNVWGRDIGHVNSDFLASRGVPKVNPIDLFNEWMRRSGNRANPKLVMQFCQKAGDNFNWYASPFTQEQLNSMTVAFWPQGKHFKGEISGQKFWTGTAQFTDRGGGFSLLDATLANLEQAKKSGAELHFGTEAQQCIMENGRVAGLVAKNSEGQYIKYKAKKGVVLAAGDFGGNKEMCRDLLPDIADLFEEGDDFRSMGRDGRGIQMGVWAGGRLEARPLATMGGNFATLMGVIETFGSLWVDENGKRYCNESFGDPVFSGFPGAQEKRLHRTKIFDSGILDDLQYGAPTHMGFYTNNPVSEKRLQDNMAAARESGPKGHKTGRTTLYSADTIEQLADCIGYTGNAKQNLVDAVKRYNEFCAAGRDLDFGKDPQLLHAINRPPYYAEPQGGLNIGMMMCTVGGLLTDEFQNVLDRKRDPIPGLYATGNCCGRRFGLQYSTPIAGVSIGICITLGREVGRIAASC